MATKSDQPALHSSIALLQERFKKLQKTREIRQERELVRLLSETRGQRASSSSYPPPSPMHYQPSASTFYNSEMIFHQGASSQPALSLWPDTQMKHANFAGQDQSVEQDHTKSWLCVHTSTVGNPSSIRNRFDDSGSDIDTSLHL